MSVRIIILFEIKKKKDLKKPAAEVKMRKITAPHEDIKGALKEVNKILQYVFDRTNDTFQVAYKKGKNIVNNAEPHTEFNYMFKVDVSS